MNDSTKGKLVWNCPLCPKFFKYFEILTDDEHRSQSLAPHLYLVHEGELRT